ncbi:phospholipase A and acyltransferase 4-like isoform X2 [Trachinotus anak]|uniref:phospholipase A and acyltransferase 4-like isoform X2 n=1 Tax=Trachinotus anak TaxID=443729 RepID=UPI0039F235B4
MPELGDLIEIFNVNIPSLTLLSYEHWAVYVGGGYVVHMVNLGSGSLSSSSSSSRESQCYTGKVKRQKLEVVADGRKWRVNNKWDKARKPRPAQEIVEEALSLVGQDMKYSVTEWNCEHFANELRYGKRRSNQVARNTAAAVGGIIYGGVLTMAAGPVGLAGGVAAWALFKHITSD